MLLKIDIYIWVDYTNIAEIKIKMFHCFSAVHIQIKMFSQSQDNMRVSIYLLNEM